MPRGGYRPGNETHTPHGQLAKAGDSDYRRNVVRMNAEIAMLDNIDLKDLEQVKRRFAEYYEIVDKYGMTITVAGLALCLNGMSRQTLWAISNDKPISSQGNMTTLPKDVVDFIKKQYKLYELQWETAMQTNKINAVAGIFLGKNNLGYRDEQNLVLTPNTPLQEEDVEQIKEKYKRLPDIDE